MMSIRSWTVLFFGIFMLLSGCAAQTATMQTERYFWPPLPDRPRIEWIHAFSSQLDIEKTSFQRFKEALVGEDAPISLVKPVNALSDPEHGRLFISDIGAARVVVFDFKNHEQRFLELPELDPPLRIISPQSLALDQAGNLYLLERRFNTIIVFNASEQYVRSIPLSPMITKPLAMAIDTKRRRLLVSDGERHSIHVLGMDGKPQFSFGKAGVGEGEFNLPVSLAISSRGEIIVADVFNARVQIFDSNGTFIRTFGSRGTGPGNFQLIKSVAVDSDDNIYVVDGRAHHIKIFSSSGQLLLVFGDYYAVSSTGKLAPGGFALPLSIHVDERDRIYVVDQLNARVQEFQYMSDAYLKSNPLPGIQY